jgi:hypothetical protein
MDHARGYVFACTVVTLRIANLPEIDPKSPGIFTCDIPPRRLGSASNKMIIEISIDHYDRLLALCGPASREYEILKDGFIAHRPKDSRYERVVEISAEMQDAQLLLALAHKICPVAVPAILKAISP